MNRNYFDEKKRYIFRNYDERRPFSSFLPGIAGVNGIPLWAFYVNRGQGICSFGVRDKDKPIMEFIPANKAYQTVEAVGFRTFIKIKNQDASYIYEPFSSYVKKENVIRNMYIGANELEIEEINEQIGLKTCVLYFILPNEKSAALVRKVSVQNITNADMRIELLDGMPALIPYGVDNQGLKTIYYTLKAWMAVFDIESKIPFFKLKASAADTSEISAINKGHFYLSFYETKEGAKILKPIIDPDVIFQKNCSMNTPEGFLNSSIETLTEKKQVTSNKIPCAFSGAEKELEVGEVFEIFSYIGHANNRVDIENLENKLVSSTYISVKRKEAEEIIFDLTDKINSQTAIQVYDEYIKQSYLDNVLRGGAPFIIKSKNGKDDKIVHLYSRKHGDLERDYNYFVLEPEFYSSGNSNYRDVNQNRRNDVVFNPEIGDFNIKTFMNLIQLDGYNPLVINGYRLIINETAKSHLSQLVDNSNVLMEHLKKPFTLGMIYKMLDEFTLKVSLEKAVESILDNSEQFMDTLCGEGFWVDHWTYNLDHIEAYLSIFPDKKERLFFEDNSYVYFDNEYYVKPRDEKYVLTKNGVRQYNSVGFSEEKAKLISSRKAFPNFMRTEYGLGDVYKTNLFSKLLSLVIIKMATLDPMGMGIEMESDKPGWNDSMNGLPGLFGSSMAEGYELFRYLKFILSICEEQNKRTVKISTEQWELFSAIIKCIEEYNCSISTAKDFEYWDRVTTAREKFRKCTMFGMKGTEVEIETLVLKEYISILISKLQIGINGSVLANDGYCPTYFYYEVKEYELLKCEDGSGRANENGLPLVKANAFSQKKLPLFIEGYVRAFSSNEDKFETKQMLKIVKESTLYDKKLKMYKANASLEAESIEIGRLRAFTPGWLENETVYLHMEYKFILELLRKELFEEFYEDFKNVFVPFLNEEVYGRSLIENSSFIVSTANPDEEIHGGGYYARLSGACAEVLSLWTTMMFGKQPFILKNGQLALELKPALPDWMFDNDNTVCINFLGKVKVIYENKSRKNTFSAIVSKIIMTTWDDKRLEVEGGTLYGTQALDVREGRVKELRIILA